jgi:hypothetical protein
MAYPLDNPLDGRGAPKDPMDGGIYAKGRHVCVRPKRSPNGAITMGGTVATCDNEDQASEIARRCAAFDRMLAALRRVDTSWAEDVPGGPDGDGQVDGAPGAYLTPETMETWRMIRAAIDAAEGR